MKLFFQSLRKKSWRKSANTHSAIQELTDDEMKLIQGASKDQNESLYHSYALATEQKRMFP
ncbi:hypothetical protein J2S13_002838 [Oikeobacillus pervagus]|uniref:Uncharacterized protein n=1 Tax=Oikeobacillus pervagus TaxID=1325931 RepID=A0AAJ1T863_9BACI|nr:hypothetical protein [Oikeobacillus pervagus]MDQ0216380.1 hypothetical protein [Oikeobacillus pervagus]